MLGIESCQTPFEVASDSLDSAGIDRRSEHEGFPELDGENCYLHGL